MAVTLADVAARARVSPATVSRVLSGKYPVAEPTRARVLRAVDELEYVANGPASALAAATSDLVGIVVADIADPFFGILAGAVQSEISAAGRAGGAGEKLPVVCSTGGRTERELTCLTLLQRQRAAAVVVAGGGAERPEDAAAVAAKLARLAASGTRVVLCGRPPVADAVTLAFDHRGGARRLTEHLLSLGHRRFGYVAGPPGRTTTGDRLAGHRAALAAAGVGHSARLVLHGPYDRASGYAATVELLRRDPGLTAVVAANDTVALGVCAALRDQGRRVPGDVSVAGFDDLPFSRDAAPALTTVRLPLREAGARAGRLALGREERPPGGVATVRGELVARASTAPPRPQGGDADRANRLTPIT
ncbi:LacI family DNA-binding transcriptional regulator [Streptomyces sp. B1866]|uniref:LacI family DNA-binding transcriptional regulator n=1 Tax=Streptomyces sp. B1866 TaxID=3075431 RepID=UPI0028917CAF|nr:LacI family DNA-binding transcriptional regulator [Streptomyces sp. B1866]MDT3399330.1 LacI family DNA-binding transcriptional regulator [Streptomyces sp. B1866]